MKSYYVFWCHLEAPHGSLAPQRGALNDYTDTPRLYRRDARLARCAPSVPRARAA